MPTLVSFVSSVAPAPAASAELRQVFEGLGFYSHQTSFDRAVTDPKLQEALNGPRAQSAASRLLRNLPELFVLHPNLVNGIFFVKLCPKLSAEERQAAMSTTV